MIVGLPRRSFSGGGNKIHAAFGAHTGFVANDFGVHGAGINHILGS
jgi:hypothetical protein